MPSDFPDAATLENVLELAAWAPSVRNSQPWHWHVDGAAIHLDADWTRGASDSGAERRNVLLGCGSILDHCAFSLAASGWHPRIRRYPNGGADGRLATVELIDRTPTSATLELASAIPRRRSDRRDYAVSPLPPTTVEMLLIRAARYDVHLNVVPRLRWHRLPDGAIRLLYGDESHSGEQHGAGDGVLLALATETDDDSARLRAGEALSHLLLSATSFGLASCALTDPMTDDRDRLALACELFDAEAHPQVLIRVGSAPSDAPELAPPPRRSVAETTTWES